MVKCLKQYFTNKNIQVSLLNGRRCSNSLIIKGVNIIVTRSTRTDPQEQWKLKNLTTPTGEKLKLSNPDNGRKKWYSLFGKVFYKIYWKWKVLVAQSCLTIWDCMDCSPPGSSVDGILQARVLEWVTIPFSRDSSWPRDRTQVSDTAGRFFTIWTSREAQYLLKLLLIHAYDPDNRLTWIFLFVKYLFKHFPTFHYI